MWVVALVSSLALLLLVLVDSFETILLPRRVTHRFRFARFYYRNSWKIWRAAGLGIRAGKRREAFLSVFGPLSLVGLFATWAVGLIVGFALLQWSLGTALRAPEARIEFRTYLYLSGTTFFTLGLGDVTPGAPLGRTLTVVESGLGFFFLAVVVGYLPVLYQAFSGREQTISLLDARAGSPPSAGECLLRLARSANLAAIDPVLVEWERWAAELLESHLSFPVLSYYRSQHDNQSWLAALTAILDTCAILMVEIKNANLYQAQLTFAMARHAAVDLALVLKTPPTPGGPDRLPPDRRQELVQVLRRAGLEVLDRSEIEAKLAGLRGLYEPFLFALAHRFLFEVPPIIGTHDAVDNWQTSAWMRRTPGFGHLHTFAGRDDHF